MATRKFAAAGVHLLTASGVVAGFLALLATIGARWEAAFAWLALATIIDGVDGPLARHLAVKKQLPRFSGERLDLIIDYFTYVVVPALMIYSGGRMSEGWALAATCIILLTALFHFGDIGSKTEDGFFVGFPALWNVIALYIFIFPLPPGLVFAGIVVFGLLTFVPMTWVHPIRVRRWRPVTIAVLISWSGAAALAVWQGFPGSPAIQAVIALCSFYLLARSLIRSFGRA